MIEEEAEAQRGHVAGLSSNSKEVAELRLEPASSAPPAQVCVGQFLPLCELPPSGPGTHFWHSSSTKALGWSSPDMVMTVSRSKAPVRVWSTVWRVMVDVV